MLVAMAFYITLPATIASGRPYASVLFRFVIPVIELVLLIPLTVSAPHREAVESGRRRMASIALIGILTVANLIALGLLIWTLLDPQSSVHGRDLLFGALQIWVTNVIAFGLLFWEVDGGGPPARFAEPDADRDFAFPQMTDPEVAHEGWYPRFGDYLYTSYTNAMAFSPTDTMPVTMLAKGLMAAESGASILTLLLVAARAVNILNS